VAARKVEKLAIRRLKTAKKLEHLL